MKTIIIIFMIVSSVFAIATLFYVAIDIILERKKKNGEAQEKVEEVASKDEMKPIKK